MVRASNATLLKNPNVSVAYNHKDIFLSYVVCPQPLAGASTLSSLKCAS